MSLSDTDTDAYEQQLDDLSNQCSDMLSALEESIDRLEETLNKNTKTLIEDVKRFVHEQVALPEDDLLLALKNQIENLRLLNSKLESLQTIFSGFHSKSSKIFRPDNELTSNIGESNKRQRRLAPAEKPGLDKKSNGEEFNPSSTTKEENIIIKDADHDHSSNNSLSNFEQSTPNSLQRSSEVVSAMAENINRMDTTHNITPIVKHAHEESSSRYDQLLFDYGNLNKT